jgi:hypothetical protein
VAEKPPISEKKKGLSQAFEQMKMRKMGGSLVGSQRSVKQEGEAANKNY